MGSRFTRYMHNLQKKKKKKGQGSWVQNLLGVYVTRQLKEK